jgi:16S rRNA (adenine1518-N6/adenine1519-N6)-dimethyltransferase
MPVRKRFGQHFLADPAIVERIFAALRLQGDDAIVEIGPGAGALTGRLLAEAGHVAAIEIDRDLAASLRSRFPSLDLVCADALTADLEPFLDTPRRLVGNLPYNIATPLLGRLFGHAERCVDMHFMLQREVAERLTASPGSKTYGRLSVIAQYHCRIERLFDACRESFRPPPKVASSFVRLAGREREPCDVSALRHIARAAFGQRRKKLGNALHSLAADWGALDIDPGRRAESLSVQEFVKIARHVREPLQGREASARGK